MLLLLAQLDLPSRLEFLQAPAAVAGGGGAGLEVVDEVEEVAGHLGAHTAADVRFGYEGSGVSMVVAPWTFDGV